jgi:uncharacterized Zn-finger protein
MGLTEIGSTTSTLHQQRAPSAPPSPPRLLPPLSATPRSVYDGAGVPERDAHNRPLCSGSPREGSERRSAPASDSVSPLEQRDGNPSSPGPRNGQQGSGSWIQSQPNRGAQAPRKPLPASPTCRSLLVPAPRSESSSQLPPISHIASLLQPPPQCSSSTSQGDSSYQNFGRISGPSNEDLAHPSGRSASCPPSRRPLPLMPPHDLYMYERPSGLSILTPLQPSATSSATGNAANTSCDSTIRMERTTAHEPSNQHKPFRCDVCLQSFSRNHDLKRHKRIHVAAKPFPCPSCNKFFSRKDALKVRHGLSVSE